MVFCADSLSSIYPLLFTTTGISIDVQGLNIGQTYIYPLIEEDKYRAAYIQ